MNEFPPENCVSNTSKKASGCVGGFILGFTAGDVYAGLEGGITLGIGGALTFGTLGLVSGTLQQAGQELTIGNYFFYQELKKEIAKDEPICNKEADDAVNRAQALTR